MAMVSAHSLWSGVASSHLSALILLSVVINSGLSLQQCSPHPAATSSLLHIGRKRSDDSPYATVTYSDPPQEGQPLMLHCALKNANQTKAIQFRWFSLNALPMKTNLKDGIIVDGDTLHIDRVTFSPGPPTYACQIIFRLNGAEEMVTQDIILKRDQSEVFGVISSTDDLHAGGELRLLCHTASYSTPIWLTESWKAVDAVGSGRESRFSVDKFGLMTVRKVGQQDAGIYRCCSSVLNQRMKMERCHNYSVVVQKTPKPPRNLQVSLINIGNQLKFMWEKPELNGASDLRYYFLNITWGYICYPRRISHRKRYVERWNASKKLNRVQQDSFCCPNYNAIYFHQSFNFSSKQGWKQQLYQTSHMDHGSPNHPIIVDLLLASSK